MSTLKAVFLLFLLGGFLISLVIFIRLIQKKISLKRAFLFMFIFGCFSLIVFYPYRSRIRGYYHRFQNRTEIRPQISSNCNCESLEVPKDSYAEKHRPLAIRLTKNGFINNEATLNSLLSRKRLLEVGESDGFYIQHLTSSTKHLTPIAKKRLEELAALFRSFLKDSKNEKDYFVISSMTRTETQQQEIRRQYPNSSTPGKSTHSFGVSFDISRVNSIGACDVSRRALIKALNQMRDEKKILLCPEFKCIHVTVVN
jgi:hypothetical protein